VIEQALQAAELTQPERRALGLFIGSSSVDISVSEARYRRELGNDSTAIPLAASSSLGNLASTLRQRFDLRGPDYSFNTACTASANALVYADAMVRAGRLEHALVLGTELFNVLTALGFHGLQLLAPGNMKPFDRQRDGLVLGEGCSALVIGPRARRTGTFYLRGSANLCDTHSISAAHPDGSTIAQVIDGALRSAALLPSDIAAIKVHGTASLLNDEAEVAGMKRVFPKLPPLCALKPYIGHTLGACGLNELTLFCGAAEQGFLPGTHGICAGDSDLEVTLNQTCADLPPGNYMLNYFGFGGNNTSLVVGNE
jgi:3-oxoacyl-[acyl-carrier-protein] synthase-1